MAARRSSVAKSEAAHDRPALVSPDEWRAIDRLLGLSERQSQIAWSLLVMGDETEESISVRLGISGHTVHSHLERLYRKLDVRSRSQLIRKLFEAYVELHRAERR